MRASWQVRVGPASRAARRAALPLDPGQHPSSRCCRLFALRGQQPVSASPSNAGQGRAPRGDPTVAALLTWFVPGAGHLLLGDVALALLGFAVVGGLYALGLSLSGGMTFG